MKFTAVLLICRKTMRCYMQYYVKTVVCDVAVNSMEILRFCNRLVGLVMSKSDRAMYMETRI